MKTRIILTLILFSAVQLIQAQGIMFETDWKTAVEKASREKKLIFMDFYHASTPFISRVYEQSTFKDSTLAQFFNRNFINIKCNIEKDWGKKASEHYKVESYPNFIFIHPESFEVHYRVNVYSQDPKLLIDEAIIANRERNAPPLSKMALDYQNGKRDEAFLKLMIQRKSNNNLDFTQEFLEYMRLYPLDNLTKDAPLNYYTVKIKYGSPEYLKLKKLKASNTRSQLNMEYIMKASVNAILDTAISRKDENLMERMLLEFAVLGETNRRNDYRRIDFYKKIDNYGKAFALTEGYINTYLLSEKLESIKHRDSISLSNAMKDYKTGKRDSIIEKAAFEETKSWNTNQSARLIASQIINLLDSLVLKINDKTALKKLMDWTEYAAQLEPQFYSFTKIRALVFYKNGEKSKAIQTIQKAIDLSEKGNTVGINDKTMAYINEMKTLLDKMKKGSSL
jgi:Protein of unknown function, DUF255